MITSDADVAIERGKVLPVYVLKDQDDIAKATAFRFVALHHINKQNCVCLTASLDSSVVIYALNIKRSERFLF